MIDITADYQWREPILITEVFNSLKETQMFDSFPSSIRYVCFKSSLLICKLSSKLASFLTDRRGL